MPDIPSVLQAQWFLTLQKEEPITAALCQLLVLQMEALTGALSGAPPVTQHHTDAMGKVVKSIREIVSWLGPMSEHRSEFDTEREKKSEWIRWCLDSGGSTLQAVHIGEVFDKSLKGKPGRPPAPTRRLAIQYVEQKLKTPSLNLPTFANANCTCGKETHGDSCKEVIRLQVIALKKVFAKHGLSWPLPGSVNNYPHDSLRP
jgi:hypothetical protein